MPILFSGYRQAPAPVYSFECLPEKHSEEVQHGSQISEIYKISEYVKYTH